MAILVTQKIRAAPFSTAIGPDGECCVGGPGSHLRCGPPGGKEVGTNARHPFFVENTMGEMAVQYSLIMLNI